MSVLPLLLSRRLDVSGWLSDSSSCYFASLLFHVYVKFQACLCFTIIFNLRYSRNILNSATERAADLFKINIWTVRWSFCMCSMLYSFVNLSALQFFHISCEYSFDIYRLSLQQLRLKKLLTLSCKLQHEHDTVNSRFVRYLRNAHAISF